MDGASRGLAVRLFGDGEVLVDGVIVEALASARLLSLLAFLVVARARPVSRQRLAFLFWPDSSEGQATRNHAPRSLSERRRWFAGAGVRSRDVSWSSVAYFDRVGRIVNVGCARASAVASRT